MQLKATITIQVKEVNAYGNHEDINFSLFTIEKKIDVKSLAEMSTLLQSVNDLAVK